MGFEEPARKRGSACLNNVPGHMLPSAKLQFEIRLSERVGFKQPARKRESACLNDVPGHPQTKARGSLNSDLRKGWDSKNPPASAKALA